MPELVSVLIPAYNAAEWLAATIRSTLAQTWPRIEVIIVDDGSKDRTRAVAKAFESRFVKVVTQEHLGAAAARNRAFELAQGTYVQWLDADDLLHPAKIRAQMKVAEELGDRRVLLSGRFGTFFYRTEKAVFTPTSLWRNLTPLEYFMTRFTENAYFQTGAWLVSRELSDAAGPWAGYRNDDGEYFCRIALQSTGIRFVEDATTYYRVGNGLSMEHARSDAALTSLYHADVKCIEYLLSLEDSARTRAAAVQLLQELLWEFYAEREDLVSSARQRASELGGTLRRPQLKWKYRPAEWLLGYNVAFRASRLLPRLLQATRWRLDGVVYAISSASRHSETAEVVAGRAE